MTGEATVGDPEPDEERLTLGRLTQERLLRRVSPGLPPGLARRPVSWCLPWDDAVIPGQNLSGVVVFAHGSEVTPRGRAGLTGAAAVIVAADHGGAPSIDVTAEPPMLYAGPQVTFRELSHLVADLTLARETHVLRYGITVHRSLVELLYRGAGLAALCHQMARLSNSAVAVLDPQLRVLAFEQSRDRVFEPGAIAAALRPVAHESPDVRAQDHARPVVHTIELDGTPITCVLTPILLAGRHDGWVVVVEPDPSPHPHDIAEHRVVVEQGATIVGTEMLRIRSVEEAEERARGDFVHALLHNRFITQHDLEARAGYYDFPVGGRFAVVVAGDLSVAARPEALTTMFQLARDATRITPRTDRATLATVVGDVLAVIRQVEPPRRGSGGASDAALQDIATYASALEQELARRVRHSVAVAYGRPYQGATHIFDSYREARIALGLRTRLNVKTVCGFQDLRVYATLTDLATTDGGRAYAADVLAPLRSSGASGADLENAVITYVHSGGNINAAARELHVHRNTMLYKLDRASRLMRVDLREPEQQFAVWLAHKLDLLAETTAAVDRDVRPSWRVTPAPPSPARSRPAPAADPDRRS